MSNLLDRASILLTPTAVSDDTLHSVKPVRTFSNELITNGGFDADTNWTKFSNATISDGVVNLPNASAAVRQTGVLENNKNYKITYDVILSSGNNILFTTRGGTCLTVDLPSSVGTHTVFARSNSTGGAEFFISVKTSSDSAVVDNVSVKKVTHADFNFTRATTATRVNSSGLIESVASGLPRIDFTGGTGQILLEPSSSNYETNSSGLSTGWSATTGSSQQVETGITPFGVSGDIKRVSGATNSPPSWVDNAGALKKQYTVLASDPASTFTFSVYVKSAGSTTVNIQIRNNTAGPSTTTGAITLTSDWQRVSVTLAVTTTTTKIGIVIAGTDGDILLSGAQLESKTFATSLIPTSGSTVTRNGEFASSAGDSSLISTTEGVLYTETACLVDGTNNRAIAVSSDNNNYASIQYNPTSNRVLGRYRNAGTFVSAIQFDVSDRTQFSKIAFRYKQDDFALFIDGVQVGTDTSGNVLSADTFTSLNFSTTATSNPFQGKAKCVAVFKEFLDNDELECLTGSGFNSFTALAEAGSYTII